MSHEEALGLAQILLGLLLFTLGIPVLIIEISAQGNDVRHLLHKRFRGWPRQLTFLTLLVVGYLIIRSGHGDGGLEEWIAKALIVLIVLGFVAVWIRMITMNMRTSLVGDISKQMEIALDETGSPKDADLEDLVVLGEHLSGEEKTAVLTAIGTLCQAAQSRSDYEGTELEGLVRGLLRVIEKNGTDQHHGGAIQIITDCWRGLILKDSYGNIQRDFRDDHDGDVILETACSLAEAAVASRSESVGLRWLSTIPDVVELPYRIGIAAIPRYRFRIVIAAFNSLALLAETGKPLPRELIALIAHCEDAGPSAKGMARGFLERLGYFAMEVGESARNAAEDFRSDADYVTADAIGRCFKLI